MSDSPSYSERPPLQSGFRRSFTIPARSLSFHEKAGLDKTDADADVLYVHPTARIFSFSPPTDSIKSTSKAEIPPDTDYPIDAVETLPWRSRTENLAASGVMMIEKVRGSTNFLKCQTVMHAILRNSQCWCVNGESKFVLRVRKFQYYRIELPSTTEEDKAKVEELKRVFPTVMRYERTPCPFIRAFTVDLPDDAITPRRKGAWKRRDSSLSNIPDTDTPSLRRTKNEKSWSPKTPPTSYPRGTPSSANDGERGRSGGPAGLYRRSSLFEDYRNSSPSNITMREDGSDAELHDSEHDSEVASENDRSNAASPRKQFNSIKTGEQSVSHLIKDRETAIQSSRLDATKAAKSARVRDQQMNSSTNVSDLSTESSDDKIEKLEEWGTKEGKILDTVPTAEVPILPSAQVTEAAVQVHSSHEAQNLFTVGSAPSSEISGGDAARSVPVNTEYVSDAVPLDQDGQKTTATHHIDSAPTIDSSSSSEETSSSSDDEESQRPEKAQNAVIEPAVEDVALLGVQHRSSSMSTESSRGSTLESESESELESSPGSRSATNLVSIVEQQAGSHEQQEQPAPNASLHGAEPVPQSSTRGKKVVPDRIITEDDHRGEVSPDTSLTVDEIVFDDTVSKPSLQSLAIGTIVDAGRQPQALESKIQPMSHERSNSFEDSDDSKHDELSPVSSVDSFHTFASVSEAYEDEPGFVEDQSLEQRGRLSQPKFQHRRELSEMTVTASTLSNCASSAQARMSQQEHESSDAPSLHRSSASGFSWPDPATPSPHDQGGLRQRANIPRSFSPMPPASTIFTGNQHDSGRGHMTKAILQKIVVTPIEIAVLVVHILARIAGGATVNDLISGDLFKRPEHKRNVSGFADQLTRSEGSETEDDYGIPVRGRRKSGDKKTISPGFGASDEQTLEGVD